MRQLQSLALLLACAVCAEAGFRRSDWTLAAGFNVELYSGDAGSVSNARSLALSGNSKLNGPVITYVSSMDFGGKPTDVSANSADESVQQLLQYPSPMGSR